MAERERERGRSLTTLKGQKVASEKGKYTLLHHTQMCVCVWVSVCEGLGESVCLSI